uniref:Phosphoribosyltransferase domain-containing protein n=1 Tax=Gastroclonium compressum TaxID=1852973 RepID=A0A173G0C1_GASCM|nr:hypothetical protein [Coeloseira compressa]ANH09717.1 hypothetical protein [Coeloseira compressa]
MQLQIYLISHPIIQKLVSEILYCKQDTNYNLYKYEELGFLLMYEVLRKYIVVKKIYIKKVKYIQEIHIQNQKESYIIISDTTKSYKMITRATCLFPKVIIEHIGLNQYKNGYENIVNYTQSLSHKLIYILIVELHLNNYSIIKILDSIIKRDIKNSNQILIICITCSNKILEKLGNKYNNLHIYTTKITYK